MAHGADDRSPSPQGESLASSNPPAAAGTPVTFDSSTLFGGRDEVRLVHRGQEYRLRITRQGKLILTK